MIDGGLEWGDRAVWEESHHGSRSRGSLIGGRGCVLYWEALLFYNSQKASASVAAPTQTIPAAHPSSPATHKPQNAGPLRVTGYLWRDF